VVDKGQLKYELVVKDGEVQKEIGYFFQAGPFQITTEDRILDVVFKRSETLVVFDCLESGKSMCQLKFPDYSPECEPDQVSKEYGLSDSEMTALVHLKVSLEKSIVSAFSSENKHSFSVKQYYFL